MARCLLSIAGLIMVICSSSPADMIISDTEIGFYLDPEGSSELSDPTEGEFAFTLPESPATEKGLMDDLTMQQFNQPQLQESYAAASDYSLGQQPEVCTECYAAIITQSATQPTESVMLSYSTESASAGLEGEVVSPPTSGQGITAALEGAGRADDPYVLEKVNMTNLSGNGLLVRYSNAHLLLRDFAFENLSLQNRSSMPIGIETQYAKNVMIENCTGRSGESFRFTYSENVTIKNSTGRNLIMEGVNNGRAEGCTVSAITIKGLMSPFIFP